MKKLFYILIISSFFAVAFADETGKETKNKSWGLDLGVNILHSWNKFYLNDSQQGLNLDSVKKSDIRGLGFEVYLTIEHKIPVLPNFKFQYTGLTTSQEGQVSIIDSIKSDAATVIEIGLDNQITKNSYVDFSHLDATLYYRLVPKDIAVQFDLGLTARYFIHPLNKFRVDYKKVLQIENRNPSDDSIIYSLLPLIYVDLSATIPNTDLTFTAAGNFMVLSKTQFINDWKFSTKYLLSFIPIAPIGFEIGYRYFGLKSDTGKTQTINTHNHILYAGIYVSF